MRGIPGDIDVDSQPPMTVPLRHFVVATGLLVVGAALGVVLSLVPGLDYRAVSHVHLLLAGWVGITIMGAMTQFVPVWSGRQLHSRRLSVVQLWLVTGGLLVFVAGLLTGEFALGVVGATVLLAGFWTFAYNVFRTLPPVRRMDVTERHFAMALGFLVLTTTFGFFLVHDLAWRVLPFGPVTHASLLGSHLTLSVFGVILTTVVGALYQLAPMFTQTDLSRGDRTLRAVEEVGYPLGVVLLAWGRLVDDALVGQVGGVLVVAGVFALAGILVHRLADARVEWSPLLSRYAVGALALAAWAVASLPAWLADPLSFDARFGDPVGGHLLLFGAVGFVVLGTLYHVVPFIVWVNEYSDRIGYEPVPMVDDLYDSRDAALELVLVVSGFGLLLVAEAFPLPSMLEAFAGALALTGFLLFAGNLRRTIRDHSPHSVLELVSGRESGEASDSVLGDDTPATAPDSSAVAPTDSSSPTAPESSTGD